VHGISWCRFVTPVTRYSPSLPSQRPPPRMRVLRQYFRWKQSELIRESSTLSPFPMRNSWAARRLDIKNCLCTFLSALSALYSALPGIATHQYVKCRPWPKWHIRFDEKAFCSLTAVFSCRTSSTAQTCSRNRTPLQMCTQLITRPARPGFGKPMYKQSAESDAIEAPYNRRCGPNGKVSDWMAGAINQQN
jgi:hypothetical protein